MDLVTPNMHLHGHLKECLLDDGPFHSFGVSVLRGLMVSCVLFTQITA